MAANRPGQSAVRRPRLLIALFLATAFVGLAMAAGYHLLREDDADTSRANYDNMVQHETPSGVKYAAPEAATISAWGNHGTDPLTGEPWAERYTKIELDEHYTIDIEERIVGGEKPDTKTYEQRRTYTNSKGEARYILASSYSGGTDALVLSTCPDRVCAVRVNGVIVTARAWKDRSRDPDYHCCANPSEPFRLDDGYVSSVVIKTLESILEN